VSVTPAHSKHRSFWCPSVYITEDGSEQSKQNSEMVQERSQPGLAEWSGRMVGQMTKQEWQKYF